MAVLEADSPDDVDDASLRQFRVMAGLDREPLLAYVQGAGRRRARPLDDIDVPVLLSWATTTRTPATPRRSRSGSARRSCGCPATTSPPTHGPSCTAALTEFLAEQ